MAFLLLSAIGSAFLLGIGGEPLLAQAGSAPAGGGPAGTPQPSGMDTFFRTIFPLILMFIVLYWLLFRGQRKEQDKHRQMLANLKKNDRVQTIGGILGTIVDVRDNEVVLKVDESNNTKIRFNRGAIKELLAESAEAKK